MCHWHGRDTGLWDTLRAFFACRPGACARAQEGELRPQLLDRFGMSVNVATLQDTKQRTQMVMDR